MVYAKVVNGLAFLKNKQQSLAKKIKLESNRTFIVPTGFGFSFGGISFVLLVMAIGYANNLLYFFVFLLISMGLTSMSLTNKNVDSTQVLDISKPFIFAKENNQIDIRVQNKNTKSFVWDIEIAFANKEIRSTPLLVDEIQVEKKTLINWMPERRGAQFFPRLLIESRFPFKMLRSWKYYDQKNEFIVFPQRKGIDRIPKIQGQQSENELHATANDQGLFRDFREFQKSDSPTRIDWKRSLKHQKHLVKNFETSGEKKVLLTWEMTNFLNLFEDRISQLAYWIDLCHNKNELYSLMIHEEATIFACTVAHYKECMQKLALLKSEDVAA